jgi:predicted dehydrogenase
VGAQGKGNLKAFAANAVAVCDVDATRLAEAKKSAEEAAGDGRTVLTYGDYRKMLENPEIDAVVVSTPDHWHALPTIHACQAGKDVYVEKPLAHTIAEAMAMARIARETGQIVQTGSQQRSNNLFRTACEYVRSGRLGKVHTVRVALPGVNMEGTMPPDGLPPQELDYDFWLGPAPVRPYNERRLHYFFRFFWDYGGGQMTNWGAHHIDIAHWGLGMDEGGPLRVEGTAGWSPDGLYETPTWTDLTYTYPDDVTMYLTMGKGGNMGTRFEGEKGAIYVTRGKLTSEPEEILTEPLGEGDTHLYVSDNHVANFLECVKTRTLPICDVAIGANSVIPCHLGNIVARTGRPLRWDSVRREVVGDEEQAALTRALYRAPWVLP